MVDETCQGAVRSLKPIICASRLNQTAFSPAPSGHRRGDVILLETLPLKGLYLKLRGTSAIDPGGSVARRVEQNARR